MVRRPRRSTQSRSSAASDVYKRQAGRAGLLPGQPDVGGEGPGEVQLGVGGEDQPGPAVGGFGVAELRPGPAGLLFQEPERVLDIKTAQERLPGPVHLFFGGAGAGGPQPYRFRVTLAGQVIHGQPDEGALDDGQLAIVVLPGGAAGQLLVHRSPGHRVRGTVPGRVRVRGHRRVRPGPRLAEVEFVPVPAGPAVRAGLARRGREVHHPVTAQPAQDLQGQVSQQPGQPGQVIAGIEGREDVRVAFLPLPGGDDPGDHVAELRGGDLRGVIGRAEADRVQWQRPGGAARLQRHHEGIRPARDHLRVPLPPRVAVAEQPLRGGLRVRPQPVAHIRRQPDPPVVPARQRDRRQRHPQPRWDDGRIRLAADVSNWLRPDAETSPERLFCHCYARGKGNAQMIPGWPYSFVVALEPGRTSWTLPLDAVRLGPADDATEVTAAQLRDVVARIIAAGQWKEGDPDILAALDSGYDLTRLSWLLADLPLEILGRLRCDRVMYFPAPPREPGANGRPGRHGHKLDLSEPRTWPDPAVTAHSDTTRYGAADAMAWGPVHQQLARRAAWENHDGELPVVEGTLIRLAVDHLPGQRDAEPVWLWSSRAGTAEEEVNRAWQAFLRRFDIEHTFRFLKQQLGWTRPKLRDPEAADRWTWLILAAYAQLYLARPLAADIRLPWQQPCPPGRLTPCLLYTSPSPRD